MEIFNQLKDINEEVLEDERDIIVDDIKELTRIYDNNGKIIPSYCSFNIFKDNYGLTDKDLFDIIKNIGYNVFKKVSNGDVEFLVAHPRCTADKIQKEFDEIEEDVTIKKVEFKEDLTTKTGYPSKMTERIEKKPNIEYKGFTIEHSPMEMHYGDDSWDVDGWYIHSPYYLQSTPEKEKFYLPLFAEDEFGVVQNFKTAEEAKEYIDKWIVTKKGKIKLKGWKKDECHFEILPEFRKEKNLDESREETVELYYSKLPVNMWYSVSKETRDMPAESDYSEETIEYVYNVPVWYAKEALFDILREKEEYFNLENDDLEKLVEDNFEDLFDKYEEELNEYFKDSAIEEAEEELNGDDYREELGADEFKYSYSGPLYRVFKNNKEVFAGNYEDWTTAKSLKQAISNLESKAKKKNGFIQKVNLKINPKLVKIINDVEEEPVESQPKCDKCNTPLLDDGTCPKCDRHYEGESLKEDDDEESPYSYRVAKDADTQDKKGIYYLIKNDSSQPGYRGFHQIVLMNVDKDKIMKKYRIAKTFNKDPKVSYYVEFNGKKITESLEEDVPMVAGRHANRGDIIGWKQEFVETEEVEATDEYRIAKGNLISTPMAYGAKRKEKVEPKYAVYFARYVDAPGNRIVNSHKFREHDIYFDTLEKAQACVKNYGKTLKSELGESKGIEEDIEKHDELNPVLFDGEELKPEIKEAIQKIAQAFVDDLKEDEIKFDLKDIVLLGSNVSYNYTKDSDLDIHLIADSKALECPEQLTDKLYGAYRSIFNKNYPITIKGIPAEIYVELDEPRAKSNGIYSLNSGWIKKPVQQDIPDLDREAFDKLFTEWEDRYFDLVGGKELEEPEFVETETELEESIVASLQESLYDDIDKFITDIYELRKTSIANDGEFGLGNLVFKEMRNLGYLDNLKELKRQERAKELSLEQLKEATSSDIKKITSAQDVRRILDGEFGENSATLKPHSNKVESKKVLDSNYVVSYDDTDVDNKFSLDDETGIFNKLKEYSKKYPTRHPGFWVDGKVVYVDTNHLLPKLGDALSLAIDNNQKAIYGHGFEFNLEKEYPKIIKRGVNGESEFTSEEIEDIKSRQEVTKDEGSGHYVEFDGSKYYFNK